MKQRSIQLCFVLFTICVVDLARAETASDDSAKPNILFIMTDQHRWDCIGANGNELIKTPNLDCLAAKGANFTHFLSRRFC